MRRNRLTRSLSRCVVVVVLFAISRVSAEPDQPRKHPEVRRAILAGFTYTGQPRVQTPEEIRAERQKEKEASADVVKMDPVIVRADSPQFDRDLESRIRNSKYQWQHHTTLGTGVHVKNFRKTQAFVVTVLYVPIMLGFSW